MPFSGGVYNFPSLPGSFNPAVDGQNATADDWNTLAADLQNNGLSMTITRNGQSTITANIPMGGFKFTGLAAGTAQGNSVRYEQATIYDYIGGLGTSNNAGSPNTQVDVAAGAAADSTNNYVIRTSATTINLATVGANGLDAGSIAGNTWYHAFVIGKTDGTGAGLASTSPTAPTLPSGYTLKRRIASFVTNVSSHINPYLQHGDKFAWMAPVADASAAGAGSSAVTRTLTVPTGVVVEPIVSVFLSVSAGGASELAYVSTLAQTDVAATSANAQVYCDTAGATISNSVTGTIEGVFTNTSGQIRTRQAQGGAAQTIGINTYGWIDRRGKDA